MEVTAGPKDGGRFDLGGVPLPDLEDDEERQVGAEMIVTEMKAHPEEEMVNGKGGAARGLRRGLHHRAHRVDRFGRRY